MQQHSGFRSLSTIKADVHNLLMQNLIRKYRLSELPIKKDFLNVFQLLFQLSFTLPKCTFLWSFLMVVTFLINRKHRQFVMLFIAHFIMESAGIVFFAPAFNATYFISRYFSHMLLMNLHVF